VAKDNGRLLKAMAERRAVMREVVMMIGNGEASVEEDDDGITDTTWDGKSFKTKLDEPVEASAAGHEHQSDDKSKTRLLIVNSGLFALPPMAKLKDALAKCNAELQDATHESATFKPSKIFVTFETEVGQRRCLAALSQGSVTAAFDLNKDQIQPSHVWKGTNVLAVKEAPEPSAVFWEDVQVGWVYQTRYVYFHLVASPRACICVFFHVPRFNSMIFGLELTCQLPWYFSLLVFFFLLYTLQVDFMLRWKQQSFTFVVTLFMVFGSVAACKALQLATGPSGAALWISLANVVVPFVLRKLSYIVEDHVSLNEQQMSLFTKLTFFRWMNTAVVIYLITDFRSFLSVAAMKQVQAVLFADALTTPLLRTFDPSDAINQLIISNYALTQEKMNSFFLGAFFFFFFLRARLSLDSQSYSRVHIFWK
jgi:hypothetical protein